jgi:hypothetical protein
MAFGQQSGPPASPKQVQELLELVQRAGHTDFRDARGAMGLTQRQAGGKFTRDEATALIEALAQLEHEGGDDRPATPSLPSGPTREEKREAAQVDRLRGIPSEVLAGELQRRGWIVLEP